MASQTVRIIVTSSGTVTVRREIDNVADSAKKAKNEVSNFNAVLAGLATGLVLDKLVDYADSFTNIQNQLKLSTNNTQELNERTQQLGQIALQTNTSFEGVASIYSKTAQAQKQLGINTQQTLDFTTELAKATALSGSSSQTASLALVQLSQGLSRGTLQGQDLNSVLEGLPYVAKAIATGMGITTGQLKSFAEQGKVTSKQIIDAFAKMKDNIDADFGKMQITFSQAFENLTTSFTLFVGSISQTTGVFAYAANGINLLAQNLGLVLTVIAPVAAAFGVLAIQVIGTTFIGAMGAAIQAITGLVLGLISLAGYVASATVGFTIFVGEVVVAAAAFVAANAAVIGLVVAITGAVAIAAYAADVFLNAGKATQSFADYVSNSAAAVTQTFATLTDTVGTALKGGKIDFNADKAVAGLKQAADQINGGANSGADAITKSGKSVASDITKAAQSFAQYAATALSGFPTAEALQNSDYNRNPGLYGTGPDGKPVYQAGQTAAGQMQAYGYVLPGTQAGSGSAGGSSGSSGNTYNSMGLQTSGVRKTVQSYFTVGPQTPFGIGQSYSSMADAVAASNAALIASQKSEIKYRPGADVIVDPSQITSGSSGYAKGGSFRVGGSGGTDSQLVSFRATPDETVTIETPNQRRENNSSDSPSVNVAAPNVNLVLDAASLAQVMSTKAGKDAMMQHIKFSQSEFRKALGIS